MEIYKDLFDRIVSPENLFSAWDAFKSDKRNKPDVADFEWRLEENIFALHRELKNKTYKHGPYAGFYITDPKQRHIHKATVRDRVLHHAVFSVINPIFEKTFIGTSFSCRVGYGAHRGVATLERMARSAARNDTRPSFVLKCDVKRFFDSVDHDILLGILRKRMVDDETICLLKAIISSYQAVPIRERERERERVEARPRGIPIGNLTSQLFANVYLNEFDRFMKHVLHVRYYVRYTDDFAIVSTDEQYLKELLNPISRFLREHLFLELHPNKMSIGKLHQGVNFLGYNIFPHHRLLRAKTKRRMFKRFRRKIAACHKSELSEASLQASLQSYLGVLSHAAAYKLTQDMKNSIWFGS